MSRFPRLQNTVVDALDARAAAEFYRQLLGLVYRPGDEPPTDGADATDDADAADRAEPTDDADWLVLLTPEGQRLLAFQQVEQLTRTTWPDPRVPMQMHLCFMVDDPADLEAQKERAEALGATLLLHRTEEPREPLYVMADLDGHPFCLYAQVAEGPTPGGADDPARLGAGADAQLP